LIYLTIGISQSLLQLFPVISGSDVCSTFPKARKLSGIRFFRAFLFEKQ